MGFQRAFLFVVFAVVAQEILELSVIFRRHHIHNRRAFDFVQAVEAEHLEVRTVGENVHAFVYIGDGVARAFHQHACAFFAFVEFFFVIVCALAGFGLRQFTFDDQLQVFRHVVGTQVGGALAHGVNDAGFVAGLTDGDKRHADLVLLQQFRDSCERCAFQAGGAQNQVGDLFVQRCADIFQVFSVAKARGLTGVA